MMQEILSGGGLAALGIVAVTIIVLALLGKTVRASKGELLVEGGGKVTHRTAHSTCIHKMPVISLVRKAYYTGKGTGTMKSETLKQQMDAFNEYEQEIVNGLLERFAAAIVDTGVHNPYTHREYLVFERDLMSSCSSIKDSVREWFKSNHYDLKDSDEQVAYTNSKREVIISGVSRSIKSKWEGSTIEGSDLADILDGFRSKWGERIEALFRTAFSIARENSKVRKDSFDDLVKECDKIFGEGSKIITEIDA